MKSAFGEPVMTDEYLKNYGAFLLHCGATAFGVPSVNDSHPLHGELPNAKYQEAFLNAGGDERGPFVEISGRHEYKVAFNHHYAASPKIVIYENSALLDVSMAIKNLRNTPMDLMYLAHINFRPADFAELVYTAPYDLEHVRVNVNVPKHIKTGVPIEDFIDFLKRLKENPSLHHIMDPAALFDPEAVMTIDYDSDEEGLAHSLQVHPDGTADYVAHIPNQLNQSLRWIARTPNEDALGLVLPANSGNGGYLAEKAAGNVKSLAAGEEAKFDLRMGLLNAAEADDMLRKVKNI